MTTHGITASGFVAKSYNECLTDTLDAIESLFGKINKDSNSKFYQIAQIFATKESDRWEAIKYLWDMLNISASEGTFLDDIVSNFLIQRFEATRAAVELTFVCDIGTTIPAGTLVQCSVNNAQFSTVSEVTATEATVQVLARSVEYGKVFAPVNTITILVDSVVGMHAVYNMKAATSGRERETDTALRYRFLAYARKYLGASTLPSMQAKLEQNLINADIASSVNVFANDSSNVDSEGRPGHSVEIVVDCAADPDIYDLIAQEIFNCKGASVPTYLNSEHGVTGNAIDSNGVLHPINFSRVTYINAYLKITLTLSTEEFFPAQGESLIIKNCVEYGNETMSKSGQDLLSGAFMGKVFEIPGIRFATIEVSTNGTDWYYDYATVSSRERLIFSESNIIILWS